jgi:hypothetical protein
MAYLRTATPSSRMWYNMTSVPPFAGLLVPACMTSTRHARQQPNPTSTYAAAPRHAPMTHGWLLLLRGGPVVVSFRVRARALSLPLRRRRRAAPSLSLGLALLWLGCRDGRRRHLMGSAYCRL